MGFICAICSENVETSRSSTSNRSPTDNLDAVCGKISTKSKLSAVPCGHIFHSHCIDKWMNSGGQSSNLCPNCRKFIPRRSCLELYPDSYDDNSSPTSPNPDDKAKSEQHDKDIAALKSKLYQVEADFKIQLSLYELLTHDHQDRIAHFNEQNRLKDNEIATLKADAANSKHQLELEAQKLKAELHLTFHKLEVERNGRIEDRKKQLDFCDRMGAQLQAQRMEVLVHALQFQRDSSFQKTDEDLKPGPSRTCKPFKSRPILSKPRRGKKMVYEKNGDSDEIEELQLEDDDDIDIDIMACLDTRKRKGPRTRTTFTEIPKSKVKRLLPDLSLSPITLTLSSDSEEEKRLPTFIPATTTIVVGTSLLNSQAEVTLNGIPGLGEPPSHSQSIKMDHS